VKMRLIKISAVFVGVLALLLLTTSVRAQPATGSVSGTVTKDDQPVANARVAILKAPARGQGGANRGGAGGGTANGAAGEKARPQALATTTTDANGHFSFADLAAGDYVIVAGERGEGRGHQRVSVSNGQPASVTVVLRPSPTTNKSTGNN